MWGLKTKELQKYGTDITALAQLGKTDPVIGRKKELELLIETLMRRRNSRACLVGDAGVGKTAIVQALALKIARNSVPWKLMAKRIFSIDMGRIVDGAMNGVEIVKRVKDVLEEVRGSEGAVILFIEDLHNFVKDDGIATTLKFALARDDFKCIAATRERDRDEALEQLFDTIQVSEPSREESFKMLNGIIHRYQAHHNVMYTQTSLVSAIDLSKHYFREQFLPQKAINLIDKAGAKTDMLCLGYVTEVEIEHVVSDAIGVRLPQAFTEKDVTFLVHLEDTLKRSIIGQDEAVAIVCGSIRRARVGMRNEARPMPVGCFLFVGPTGSGKTEMARVLAKEYFGSEAAIVRLDACKFLETDAVVSLVGHLAEEVRQRPDSLVLIDGIEKAHEDVLNAVLRSLNGGRMKNSQGKVVDFSKTIVVVISNAESCHSYKAELVNGFDQVVEFKPLEKEHVQKILEFRIEDLRSSIFRRSKIRVRISEKLKEWLLSVGYDEIYGAHKLKRAFASSVETKLAYEILCGRVAPQDTVNMDVTLTGDVECRVTRFKISRDEGQGSHSDAKLLNTLCTVSKDAKGRRLIKTTIGGVDSEIVLPLINKHRHQNPLDRDYRSGTFVHGVESEVVLQIVKSFYD